LGNLHYNKKFQKIRPKIEIIGACLKPNLSLKATLGNIGVEMEKDGKAIFYRSEVHFVEIIP